MQQAAAVSSPVPIIRARSGWGKILRFPLREAAIQPPPEVIVSVSEVRSSSLTRPEIQPMLHCSPAHSGTFWDPAVFIALDNHAISWMDNFGYRFCTVRKYDFASCDSASVDRCCRYLAKQGRTFLTELEAEICLKKWPGIVGRRETLIVPQHSFRPSSKSHVRIYPLPGEPNHDARLTPLHKKARLVVLTCDFRIFE